MVKKWISILLILLMVMNTSCYSTYPVKKEEIESQQHIIITMDSEEPYVEPEKHLIVTTDNDQTYIVFAKKVTADTLYGKNIVIPIKNIKSIEVREENVTGTVFLTLFAIGGFLFFVLVLYALSNPLNI